MMKLLPGLFSDAFDDMFYDRSNMKTDIRMKVGNYVLDMELPGYQKENIQFNGELKGNMIEAYCRTDAQGKALLEAAFDRKDFSARAYHRILKVSRTIADMEGSELIKKEHIGEALSYRAFDKKYWS